MQTARHIISIVAAIAVVLYLINQCRKPHGWLGRFFLWEMGSRHSELTDWGLTHVTIEPAYKVLDIGCGGGRLIKKLSGMATAGKVFGVDYSAASVSASRSRNHELIQTGRVEVQQSSVSKLPFPDSTFDLVTAVETHYYWPNLVADLRETLRVLKPGGKLLILAEAYKRSPVNPTRVVMKTLRASYLSANEHHDVMEQAGYTGLRIIEDRKRGWLCAIGIKPETRGESSSCQKPDR